MSDVQRSSDFNAAAEQVQHLGATPTQDQLLRLYALYKQATQSTSFNEEEQFGMFDFKGKAKHKAWKEVREEEVTPENAERQYIELVKVLKTQYGVKA